MDFQRADALATHASLLERLKDLEDQDSWREFYATYRKLIFSFALDHGLTQSEAEEVVQETVITVARNLPAFRYDPKRCAFKTWLFNLTLWRVRDQLRKRHPEEVPATAEFPGSTTVPGEESGASAEPKPPSERWETAWRRDLMERALEKLRTKVDEKQFQIFDLYALQEWPAGKVARSLGVSVARVYVTKHRVMALLKKETRRLRAEDEQEGREQPLR